MLRTVAIALTLTTPLSAQEIERGIVPERVPFASFATDPYTLTEADAPFFMMLERWLYDASIWSDDAESFAAWCEQYAINPAWPSAAQLAVAHPALNDAFGDAVIAEREGRSDITVSEWRSRELGRLWIELQAQLAADGLPWSMYALAAMIDKEHRDGFERRSTEPYTPDAINDRAGWFWSEVERDQAGRDFAASWRKGTRQ